MTIVLEDKRKAVIREPGHVLVLGGPGAGKTTLAILKAQARMTSLLPGQKILFLSFSRAAVQQILLRCNDVLTADEVRKIDVRTYHSLCWDLIKSHGRALRGVPVRMLTPGREGVMRTRFAGDWDGERRRLLDEESSASFEAFAHAVARLVEESQHLRNAIGDIYPLLILDEFQDTDDDQWRLVRALSAVTKCAFLADPEQRIYDFRRGVREDRLDILRSALPLLEADLQADNFRSNGTDILTFANAVVAGRAPIPRCRDVSLHPYSANPNVFRSTVQFHIGLLFGDLRRRGISDPSVAVLASTNDLVADISDFLQEPRNFNGQRLAPISHDVVWDAELSAAAALSVAALLEQGSSPSVPSRMATLQHAAEFWLLKKDWCEQHGSRGAGVAEARSANLEGAVVALRDGNPIRTGLGRHLAAFSGPMTGDAVLDWRAASGVLANHADLKDIASQGRMVRTAGK